MRYLAVGFLLAVLGACTTQQVVLRDRSGKVATCGPYYNDGGAVAYREAQCIADYQRQGFERAPH